MATSSPQAGPSSPQQGLSPPRPTAAEQAEADREAVTVEPNLTEEGVGLLIPPWDQMTNKTYQVLFVCRLCLRIGSVGQFSFPQNDQRIDTGAEQVTLPLSPRAWKTTNSIMEGDIMHTRKEVRLYDDDNQPINYHETDEYRLCLPQ